MKGKKSAPDTNLTDGLNGLGTSGGPRMNHELGAQQLKLPTAANRAVAGGQLFRERLIDLRELVLTAHEKQLIAAWLGLS
jgi:hypothetical protein